MGVSPRTHLLAGLCLVTFCGLSLAQPPRGDRGDRGRGDRGGGPSDFIRRMDRNGNGTIEPDEVPSFMRSRWESRMREYGLDPNRPISMRRLEERRERARNESDSRDSSDGDEDLDVLGFGNEFEDTPVPGFGDEDEGEEWQSQYSSRTLDSAGDTIRRYDRNKNGVLERSEWKAVPWRSDPNQSDLNKDGKLTLQEMTARHDGFRRGGDSSRGSSSGDSSRGSSSGDRSRGSSSSGDRRSSSSRGRDRGGSSGGSSDDMTARIMSFYTRYDTNGNGRFDPDEIQASERLQERIRQMGMDPGRSVSMQDFAARRTQSLASSGGFMGRMFGGGRGGPGRGGPGGGGPGGRGPGGFRGGGGFTSGGSGSNSSSSNKKTENNPKKRFKTAEEILPEGLPSYFRDADGDGQVSMAEFLPSQSWNDQKVKHFQWYDLNQDGLITATEALAMIETPYRGSGSRNNSFVSDPPGSTSPATSNSSKTPTPSASAATTSSASDKPVIRRYFDKYDKNKNGVLEKSEWSTSSLIKRSPKDFDPDGNGQIPYAEFAKAYAAKYGG